MTCTDLCVCVCAQHISTSCAEILLNRHLGINVVAKPGRALDFVMSRPVFSNPVPKGTPTVHIFKFFLSNTPD